MQTLLQIDSSPMGEASISRHLTKEFVRRWRLANPQGRVVSRDLTAVAIPVIDAAWVAANWTPKESRTPQQNQLLTFSTKLTAELLDADEYVIGVPMHNFGPSASFKLWVDYILRVGETIVITPSGIKGTLDRKRVAFCIASGGHYGPGSASAANSYLEPWLRTFFGYLGVENMQFVIADGAAAVTCGEIDRAAFLAPHLKTIEALFSEAFCS